MRCPACLPQRLVADTPAPPSPAPPATFADPTRPLVVDLGCGPGRFLLLMHQRHKAAREQQQGQAQGQHAAGSDALNFLGIEIRQPVCVCVRGRVVGLVCGLGARRPAPQPVTCALALRPSTRCCRCRAPASPPPAACPAAPAQLVDRAQEWARRLGCDKDVAFVFANATVSLGTILQSYPGG